ncbi:MAG: T9SS type A sorting domain-containing protein [Muribaculaceae bacterium]|nr:T9SS type A sorting domain-containing protein [Muribaculaceae bacterium]
MKKQLSISLALLLPALCGGSYASANAFTQKTQQNYFRYAPKTKAPDAIFASQAAKAARVAASPAHTFSEADNISWLEGPDGSTWFCTVNFISEEVPVEGGYGQTMTVLKGWEYTVYDSQFKLIGTVKDMIDLAEGESRVAAVEISSVVTKKFFNSNDKYEIIVCTACNASNYTVNYHSYAYSIGGEKDEEGFDVPLSEFDGYLAAAFNNAKDKWSEDFYIGFLTETSDPTLDERLEYLHSIKSVVSFYKKAGWNPEPSPFGQLEVQMASLPGDQESTPFAVEYQNDGKWGLALSHYEKPFFIDPAPVDMDQILEMTPDNNLVIELYTPGISGFELQQTTKIPVVHDQSKHVATFYGIGSFRYDGDINFGDIDLQNPDKAAFLVTRQTLAGFNDDYEYCIQQYDSEGKMLKTIAEDMEGFIMLSDIKGFEPQCMFIRIDPAGGDYIFDMTDLYSGNTVARLAHYTEGAPLTANVDRVRTGDSYQWVFTTGDNRSDAEKNTIENVVWVDTEGHITKIDELNIGKRVAYAQIYISNSALDPYLFDTDAAQEYMCLVKRFIDSGSATNEELLILSNEGKTLMTVEPDDVRGALRQISIVNGNQLAISFYNQQSGEYTQEIHSLPLNRFAGGDGTVDNPYRIVTPGDFRLVSEEPSAHYVLDADLDMQGYGLENADINFTGSFDGQGKFIRNLSLDSEGVRIALFGNLGQSASVKNLNFINTSIHFGKDTDQVGLIAASATGATIDNVHAYGLEISGPEGAYPLIGGIAAKTTNYSTITNSSVANASIVSPESQIGGIVGSMLTASQVRACAFTGAITGNDNVGGITGELYAAESNILDCHVDADLTANNTVGGIAGASNRGKIANCHVEGSITALAPNRWNNYGPCAGGVVGQLAMEIASANGIAAMADDSDDSDDSDDNTTSYCVYGNFVNLSALKGFECPETEEWPGQYDTMHRIAGRTALNINPEDTSYTLAENGISDNFAHSGLEAVSDSETYAAMEGESADDDDLTAEFFAERGFKYGSDTENPWQSQPEWRPTLHHELSAMALTDNIETKVDRTFTASALFVSRVPMTEEDVLGSLICEFDESLLEMTGNYSFASNILEIEFLALAEGNCNVTIGTAGASADVNVTILSTSSVGDIAAPASGINIAYDGSAVMAEGCTLEIYSISGQLMAGGTNRLSTAALEQGVYVVRACDSDGNSATAKLVVK